MTNASKAEFVLSHLWEAQGVKHGKLSLDGLALSVENRCGTASVPYATDQPFLQICVNYTIHLVRFMQAFNVQCCMLD